MVGEAQEQSHPKRPVKQVTPRPVTDGLYLACAQGIELGINLGQRRAVIGMRVAATRRRCHRLQRLLIEFLFARRRRVAHGHAVDNDLLIAGDLRRLGRRHLAAGIVAIGEDDEHAVANACIVFEDGDR